MADVEGTTKPSLRHRVRGSVVVDDVEKVPEESRDRRDRVPLGLPAALRNGDSVLSEAGRPQYAVGRRMKVSCSFTKRALPAVQKVGMARAASPFRG